MKGVLNFLEKAGLVTLGSAPASEIVAVETPAPPVASAEVAQPVAVASPVNVPGQLDFAAIYAVDGVPASNYPAERLLRVIDGLNALDPATRLVTIRAIDEADESWTIDDPLADAGHKIAALEKHSGQLTAALAAVEAETQTLKTQVASREESVVSEVRRQIAELEALVTREIAKAAQERGDLDANLAAARDQTTRDVAEIAAMKARLQSLTNLFVSSSQ